MTLSSTKLTFLMICFRLSLLQRDYAMGQLPFCEFSVRSRNSIETLKQIDNQKKMLLSFDKFEIGSK